MPLTRSSLLGIAAMATSAFVFVTAETIPVGLLPQMSRGLGVSEGDIGLLLTLYAAVAGLTAIPLTSVTTHLPRRRLVVGSVALLAITQLAASIAPSFALVAAARLVCACSHGVFWSVLAPVAARLAPRGQSGRATSLVFVGNSAALVFGVPLGTLLGQLAGWRIALAAIGVLAALSTAALLVLLPQLDGEDHVAPLAQRLRSGVTLTPALGVICAVTAILIIGQFAAYTYIAPIVKHGAGLAGFALSCLLLGYGVTGIFGNVLAGRGIDHRPRLTLATCVSLVGGALLLLGLAHSSVTLTVLAVLVWGGAFSAVPTCLQSVVLRVSPENPDTASASYVVAFQIGIGGGALLGGRIVDAGHVGLLPLLAAGCAAVAVALVVRTKAFR